MRYTLVLFAILSLSLLLPCCSRSEVFSSLNEELEATVAKFSDARIGIAIITEKDTFGIAFTDTFPMMSVYKFPIVLALADRMRYLGKSLDEEIVVPLNLLPKDTYSPMLKDFADLDTINIPIRDLVRYSLSESDNNASDILLDICGGAYTVDSCLRAWGYSDITVKWSEEEVYSERLRSYDNCCTPLSIASIFYNYARTTPDPITSAIKSIIEECVTGTDRIPAPLTEKGCIIGHKTGTGFVLPDGRLMAINDAGYVIQPDGRTYSLSVMIENSGYTPEETSHIIAIVSEIVFRWIND